MDTRFDIAHGLGIITPYRQRLRQMLRNRAWLAANIDALCRENPDQWVVIDKQMLMGVGPSPEAASAAAGPFDAAVALVLMLPRHIPQPI